MISLILGALLQLILTEKALRMTNSDIEELAANLELLPVNVVPVIMRLIADLWFIFLSVNLIWFLESQIVLIQLITADKITILHKGGSVSVADVNYLSDRRKIALSFKE